MYGIKTFYFKPSIPVEDFYDRFLFSIKKKTEENAGERAFMDGYREVMVGGVTYMCGGPTDLTYEGPEQDLFSRMGGDVFSVYATIRKI